MEARNPCECAPGARHGGRRDQGPAVGESITEGTLNRWLKPDGAYVKVDEPLYELGTDKATQEIAAPVAGMLTTKVKEGDTVAVGAVVATIDTSAQGTAPKQPRRQASGAEVGGQSSEAGARTQLAAGLAAGL